ncbi:hypothetical protein KEM60_00530 [Austwickia sp. TVS 96-490-7B]|uniref:DUF2695 domain-containing protein n=1 Tax=Austwickia sp. TVS 96-490-7B TaxID=2830843 RepID=UPI001C5A509B|nr:hypothetical protein [Austwickia sp. TVS 96-490-7B]
MEDRPGPHDADIHVLPVTETWPHPGECLTCYLTRMTSQFGCRGFHWTTRFRDVTAPQATALLRRLSHMGGYCDCEVLMNAYVPRQGLEHPHAAGLMSPLPTTTPTCQRVRRGSTRPCTVWVRRRS